jgi:hypothetical protein
MSLPETIRVKLSTEAAGAISLTQVVVRDMPARELIELMLGITGKNLDRIHDLLLRGTLVSGASRLRWQGWDADPDSLREVLASFPGAEPDRPFARERCMRVVLRRANTQIDISREVGSQRRLLRRASFWDVLMEVAGTGAPRYLEYSYRDRADRYRVELSPEAAARLRQNAPMIRYSAIEAQIQAGAPESMDLYVTREPI